jgi:ribosomal protein S18 acetylase RimI-like enzyme
MPPRFRAAKASDTETLVAFMALLYQYDHSHFDEVGCRKALPAILEDEAFGKIWMIESDETAIGYIVLTFGYSLEFHGRDAFIDELFIIEDHRKQGIGKQAIDLAIQTCRDMGIAALHLEVEHDNTNAQSVYRRLGFKDHSRYLMTKWTTADSNTE